MLVVAISKKASGYNIKYDVVGLPLVSDIPGLENALDNAIRTILKDLSGFKDAQAFTDYVSRKVVDLMLHETGKEPKVVVVVQ